MERDFLVFWTIGQNILRGLDPYLIEESYYPPAMQLLFALFALFPLNISYFTWSAFNTLFLVRTLHQKMPLSKAFVWFAYTPVLFILFTGQVDILFFCLASYLGRKGWPAAIAAALITLKPQIALVVLPWTLLCWLRKDLKSLAKFIGCTLVLWCLPLLINPALYENWLMKTQQVVNKYFLNSPGLFSLAYFPIPIILLFVLALGIAIYGLTLGLTGSWNANLLATPFGFWYNSVLLTGTVPWQWMIPISWAAFLLAVLAKGAYPFALIPAAAFIWMVKNQGKIRSENEQIDFPFRFLAIGQK